MARAPCLGSFFFFSSRRRHTRLVSDWSSDVCSSDLRGRFGIIEVLTVSAEVERRIAAGETAEHIAGAARRSGMKGLWDSGLEHVLRGESTLDELTRVVDIPEEDDQPPDATAGSRRSTGGG